MTEFNAYRSANRDRELEDLSESEIAGLDRWLDSQAAKSGPTFGEVAFSGMARGVPGLIVARQIQRNQLERAGGAEINTVQQGMEE